MPAAKLQSAATTGNGSVFDARSSCGTYVLEVEASGTISGGSVQFEHARSASYTGTWAPIGTAITPVTNALVTQSVTGAYRAVRARIASNITGGGSVTCRVNVPAEVE